MPQVVVLRAGLLALFFLLLMLKNANASRSFVRGPTVFLLSVAAILAICVIVGYFTRVASIISCGLWGWGRRKRANGRSEMGIISL